MIENLGIVKSGMNCRKRPGLDDDIFFEKYLSTNYVFCRGKSIDQDDEVMARDMTFVYHGPVGFAG